MSSCPFGFYGTHVEIDIQVVSPFLYSYPSPLDKRLSFLLEKVIISFKGGHHNTHCATPSACPVSKNQSVASRFLDGNYQARMLLERALGS